MRAGVAVLCLVGLLGLLVPLAEADEAAMVKVRLLQEDGKLGPVVETKKVVKSDEEWKKLRTPKQYEIARSKGTERPFCGGLLTEKRAGLFVCVCCDLPLFESNT